MGVQDKFGSGSYSPVFSTIWFNPTLTDSAMPVSKKSLVSLICNVQSGQISVRLWYVGEGLFHLGISRLGAGRTWSSVINTVMRGWRHTLTVSEYPCGVCQCVNSMECFPRIRSFWPMSLSWTVIMWCGLLHALTGVGRVEEIRGPVHDSLLEDCFQQNKSWRLFCKVMSLSPGIQGLASVSWH